MLTDKLHGCRTWLIRSVGFIYYSRLKFIHSLAEIGTDLGNFARVPDHAAHTVKRQTNNVLCVHI